MGNAVSGIEEAKRGICKEAYILTLALDGLAVISEAIGKLIGQTVCVSYTTTVKEGVDQSGRTVEIGERKNFEPQISVQGVLEGSSKTENYRVLVDDNTYTYFYDKSVWSIGQDVDKRAIVFIR